MTRLPTWWRRAGISAKADFLVRTGEARSYSEACSLLCARRKRTFRITEKAPAKVARLPYRDD